MATTIKARLYTNSDDAFVAWAPSEFIPGCRGFLLERGRRSGSGTKVEEVENRLGFKKDDPHSGDHKPSSFWPFQRFNWTDHAVDVGNQVRYRVTAMIDDGSGRPYKKGASSRWTRWAKLSPSVGRGLSCYFNRGLVLSQFVARYLRDKKISPATFKARLKTSLDPEFRRFLEGDLGARIGKILKDAKEKKTGLYAALYELGDAKLEDGLIALGPRLHLILANGSDKSGDGNADARNHLNNSGIPTIDRMLKSKGLGHNKFVVLSRLQRAEGGLDRQHQLEHHRALHPGQQRTADQEPENRSALPQAVGPAQGRLTAESRSGQFPAGAGLRQRQLAQLRDRRSPGHGLVHPHLRRAGHGCPARRHQLGEGRDPVPDVHAGQAGTSYAGRPAGQRGRHVRPGSGEHPGHPGGRQRQERARRAAGEQRPALQARSLHRRSSPRGSMWRWAPGSPR